MYLKLFDTYFSYKHVTENQLPVNAIRLLFMRESYVISITSCKVTMRYTAVTYNAAELSLLKPWTQQSLLGYHHSIKHAPPLLSITVAFDLCILYYVLTMCSNFPSPLKR
jgi:hypothetical protein